MKLQFLGTGDVGQAPVFRCDCPACRRARAEPRWRRLPCSARIEFDDQRWLIDAGRHDLAALCEADPIDGIFLTHYHADHVQGLLHLRWGAGARIPVHGPVDDQGFSDLYKHPGVLDFSSTWQPLEQRTFGSMQVTAVALQHSRPCLGYVFAHEGRRIAYLTDTSGLPDDTRDYLRTVPLDVCIVDCTHPPQAQRPRNHNDLNAALAMCDGLDVGQVLLTHLGHGMSAWLMEHGDSLPAHVGVPMDGDWLTD